MSTLWRGLASQFFLIIGFNQIALAAEPLTGNIEKFSIGAAAEAGSLNGSVKNANLKSSSATGGFNTANSDSMTLNSSTKSAELNGSISQNSGSGLVLQGGIEDGGSLNHSAKLIPDRASKPMLLKGESKQVNYPLVDSNDHAPQKPVTINPVSAMPATPTGTPHFIPPLSSYNLTPRIGVITTPGYSVPSATTVKGVSSYVPGFEVTTVKTNDHVVSTQSVRHSEGITRSGGVTSYVPGYSVQTVRSLYYGTGTGGGNGLAIGHGVMSYVSGYEVATVPVASRSSVSSTRSDSNVVTTHGGITSYVPGFATTIVAAPKSSSTWNPGHVETVAMADFSKNTIAGVWYSPSTVDSIPQLVANTETLPVNRTYVTPIIADDNKGLKATAQILSVPHSSMGADWDAWYDKVGRSIYSRWERAEVGPGAAKVRITVDQFRNLSCQVVGFRTAAYAESDSVSETAFRVTALRAVNDLSQYEIPELPQLPANKHSVTFDLEMSRAVNGPSGFIVAAPRF